MQMKKQAADLEEKIFANHLSNKGLISRIYEDLPKPISENNPVSKRHE
jgi:hypothetical protein